MAFHLRIAHSPDSDDAYMMAPLALGWMEDDPDCQQFSFEFFRQDIEQLNQASLKETFDVTAISFGVYPKIQSHYHLLTAGSSIQEGTGPVVVSFKPLSVEDLAGEEILVPGFHTSAYLALSKIIPKIKVKELPFDQIMPEVVAQRFGAGLLIHESQLLYRDQGLHLVLDLGAWWKEHYDLPLPMGGNAIRSSLEAPLMEAFARCMRKSVVMARARHWESVDYAQGFGRGMDRTMVSEYVQAWVNDFTEDPGIRGRAAVAHLLGLTPRWVQG